MKNKNAEVYAGAPDDTEREDEISDDGQQGDAALEIEERSAVPKGCSKTNVAPGAIEADIAGSGKPDQKISNVESPGVRSTAMSSMRSASITDQVFRQAHSPGTKGSAELKIKPKTTWSLFACCLAPKPKSI